MWIVCQADDLQEMSTYFYENFKKKKKNEECLLLQILLRFKC